MKRTKTHILLLLMLITFALLLGGNCCAEKDLTDIKNAALKCADAICTNVKEPTFSQIGGEWAVFGVNKIKCAGYEEFVKEYVKNIADYIKECGGVLSDRKYTEYSRCAIALTSLGYDAQNVCGYNLVLPLLDCEKVAGQRVNGPAWALCALDCGDYEKNEKGNFVRKKYIENLLNSQNDDGGWAIGGLDISDVDVTSMVITSLSKYLSYENVKISVDKAVLFLSENQDENGGYVSWQSQNSESISQVIIALNSIGINLDDSRFVKNGKTLADILFSYYDNNGGFYHLPSDESINQMSTEQGLCALLSIVERENNKKSIYDFSNVSKKALILNENTNINFGLDGKNKDIVKNKIISEKTFDDIFNDGAKYQIEALASRGIISGKSEKLFEPDMSMTRAEFATIVTKALGLSKGGKSIFCDVDKNDWFYDFVYTAYSYKIVSGTGGGAFNPNGVITKEEAAVMIKRAAYLCGIEKNYNQNEIRDVLSAFSDYKSVSDWAQDALAFCYDEKIISEDELEIKPKCAVTRNEIAAMLYNLLETAKLL